MGLFGKKNKEAEPETPWQPAVADDANWHHYALVYDGDNATADIVRLYRDRVQVTTRTATATRWKDLKADRLYIGARGGSAYKFVGELDDIKITGRALAPAEFMTKRTKPPSVPIQTTPFESTPTARDILAGRLELPVLYTCHW